MCLFECQKLVTNHVSNKTNIINLSYLNDNLASMQYVFVLETSLLIDSSFINDPFLGKMYSWLFSFTFYTLAGPSSPEPVAEQAIDPSSYLPACEAIGLRKFTPDEARLVRSVIE